MKTLPAPYGQSVHHSSVALTSATHRLAPEELSAQPNHPYLSQHTPAMWPGQLTPTNLLTLQRTIGNHAVQRLLQRQKENAPAVEPRAPVQRAALPAGDHALMTPEVDQGINQARGHGSPLPSHLQRQMEGHFGVNFGAVRVHTDKQAGQLSRSLEARAFTTGSDIFFQEGAYRPAESSGQRLLAHELTHVVQQGGVQRSPLVQRVRATEEFIKTQLGGGKYNKIKAAGKLLYFTSLEESEVLAYRGMETKIFIQKLNKLPGKPRKTNPVAPTPKTPQVKPLESTSPEPKPIVPKDPEVAKQELREMFAADFEKKLTPLLDRFATIDIENEKDVMSLLDDVVADAVLPLFQDGMLRQTANLKKVIDKLQALHVTAWTLGKKPIYKRLTFFFTDMARVVPQVKDFAADEQVGKKLTQGKELKTTRKTFINEQRDAAKNVGNPSLKVNEKLTIAGYKILQWYNEATRAKLPQFYDSTSGPANAITPDRSLEHLTIAPGNWLNLWAQLYWKDRYIKNNYRSYGKTDRSGNFGLLGDIRSGTQRFNVEDKLWVKEDGEKTATRYNVLGSRLDSAKTPKERAQRIREVVSGDTSKATNWEMEAAMAMLGAETARNPRSYGMGLMLLDMIEGGGTYGKNKKGYTFNNLLGSSPHDRESSAGFRNRKTNASAAKQARWGHMMHSITTEAPPKFRTMPFEALWAGKWPMSPSASMTLGESVIPNNSAQLNTVQYKELKTILNWYINFMRGAELNVKDETEAKNALIKLFKERLGKTAKMGAGSFQQHFA